MSKLAKMTNEQVLYLIAISLKEVAIRLGVDSEESADTVAVSLYLANEDDGINCYGKFLVLPDANIAKIIYNTAYNQGMKLYHFSKYLLFKDKHTFDIIYNKFLMTTMDKARVKIRTL